MACGRVHALAHAVLCVLAAPRAAMACTCTALGVLGMFGGGVVNAPRRNRSHSEGTRHGSRASRDCVFGHLLFAFGPGVGTPNAVWLVGQTLVLADLTVLNTAWGPAVCGAAYAGVARDSRRRGLGSVIRAWLGARLRVLDA